MTKLLEAALAAILVRSLPIGKADACLIIEIVDAAWAGLSRQGIECRFGAEGTSGKPVCRPERWTDSDWARRDRVCRGCPVFKKALERERTRT